MTEEKFHDTGLGYNYLDMTLKAQATKEKTDKLTSSRLKTSAVQKTSLRKGRDKGISTTCNWGFPGDAVDKNMAANAGDTSSIPGLGRIYLPQTN